MLSNCRTPSFFGTIYHPVYFKIIFVVLCLITILYNYTFLKAGDIAVELVKEGFATCQNRNMKFLEGSANYIQSKSDKFEEKIFATVSINGM